MRPMCGLSRRRFGQGIGAASLTLLTGCGRLPFLTAPARVPRLGFLSLATPAVPIHLQGLRQGLLTLGYVEGQSFLIEYRWAEGQVERLPDLAADLIRLPVDVLIAADSAAAVAAKHATAMVPILFIGVADPVRQGLVDSLARPGGNVTGLSQFGPELSGKRLELLGLVVGRLNRLAVLWNPANPGTAVSFAETSAAAEGLGWQVQSLEVRGGAALAPAFAAATQAHAEALSVLHDSILLRQREAIVPLAAQSRLPAIYELREYVEAGGLMAYGAGLFDIGRRAATYVDKLLKGTRPQDLPVEQPMRLDFVLNMPAAQALGLTIPKEVLLQATDVIQ